LYTENHVNLCIPGVGWERAYTQLDYTYRGYKEEDDIEEEAVHPSLVTFHWMESAAARDSNPELYVAFLDAPQHIQAEICEYKCGDKTCVAFFQRNKELI